jgi:hypothetical protein
MHRANLSPYRLPAGARPVSAGHRSGATGRSGCSPSRTGVSWGRGSQSRRTRNPQGSLGRGSPVHRGRACSGRTSGRSCTPKTGSRQPPVLLQLSTGSQGRYSPHVRRLACLRMRRRAQPRGAGRRRSVLVANGPPCYAARAGRAPSRLGRGDCGVHFDSPHHRGGFDVRNAVERSDLAGHVLVERLVVGTEQCREQVG